MLMGMEICEPSTKTQWQQYYDLRQRVLGTLAGHSPELLKDSLEEDSYHLMVVEDGRCVGVGRVHFNHAAEGQIRFMAVDADCRERGIGRAILEALEIYLLRNATASVVLNAHSQAVGFYQKHGYAMTDDEVSGQNVHCVKMCKQLMR